MPQKPFHRHNLQDLNGRQRSQRLQEKASLRQMSDTRGSLPNNTMGLLLMVKVRDLDQATGGRSNVGPRDRQVDMIKMMDPVGLMVRSPQRGISSPCLTIYVEELPILKDNIKKGFLETQSTVNKWVTSLKKKIDGEDDDDFQGRPPQQGYPAQQQYGGRRSSEYRRRSADRERYDADPQVLGDDFAGLQMRDNEGR